MSIDCVTTRTIDALKWEALNWEALKWEALNWEALKWDTPKFSSPKFLSNIYKKFWRKPLKCFIFWTWKIFYLINKIRNIPGNLLRLTPKLKVSLNILINILEFWYLLISLILYRFLINLIFISREKYPHFFCDNFSLCQMLSICHRLL